MRWLMSSIWSTGVWWARWGGKVGSSPALLMSQHWSVRVPQQAMFCAAHGKPQCAAVRRGHVVQTDQRQFWKMQRAQAGYYFPNRSGYSCFAVPTTEHGRAQLPLVPLVILSLEKSCSLSSPFLSGQTAMDFALCSWDPPVWSRLHPQHPLVAAPSLAGPQGVHSPSPGGAQARLAPGEAASRSGCSYRALLGFRQDIEEHTINFAKRFFAGFNLSSSHFVDCSCRILLPNFNYKLSNYDINLNYYTLTYSLNVP